MSTCFKDNNWTIPNLLTVARILLTPGFIMAFLAEHFAVAWILFGAAAFTDGLDGFIAKRFNQHSSLGAMLDPLADKVLLVTAFLSLAAKGWIPTWLAVLVVSRDVIIVGGLVVLHFSGVNVKENINPSIVSKMNTTAQFLLIVCVLAEKTFATQFPAISFALIASSACLTVLSGIHYVWVGFGLYPDGEESS